MPIYEYKCRKCSLQFELRRNFNETSPIHCPSCHGEVHRVFSPVPIIFKGAGFYVTDNRPNGRSASTPSLKESEESKGVSSKVDDAGLDLPSST